MTFELYVKEELAYYDQHPEEDDQLTECHSNSFEAFDLEYTTAEWEFQPPEDSWQTGLFYNKIVTKGFLSTPFFV